MHLWWIYGRGWRKGKNWKEEGGDEEEGPRGKHWLNGGRIDGKDRGCK